MIDFNSFVDQWNRAPISGDNAYLAIEIDHPLRFQVGYHDGGHKSLVVMNADDALSATVPSSYAIKASFALLADGSHVLEFLLVHSSFEEIFLRLCWDMIDCSAKSQTPFKTLISRYLSWQKLLQQSGEAVLSKTSQKGLLGELLFLQEIIPSLGSEKAILSWVGPDGSDQDFIFKSSWAEIKTTSAASEAVIISSLEQLEQNTIGRLVVYKLEETTPGENRITLPNQVCKIKELLRDDIISSDRFITKLIRYGYRKADEDKYGNNQYRFIDEVKYEVNSDFPRLTRNSVATQIIRCRYALSLAAIEPFRRDN